MTKRWGFGVHTGTVPGKLGRGGHWRRKCSGRAKVSRGPGQSGATSCSIGAGTRVTREFGDWLYLRSTFVLPRELSPLCYFEKPFPRNFYGCRLPVELWWEGAWVRGDRRRQSLFYQGRHEPVDWASNLRFTEPGAGDGLGLASLGPPLPRWPKKQS